MARKLVIMILAFAMSGFVAAAQSKDYFRIARLSYLEGKVSFQHIDEVDWTSASINLAFQPGDRLYTGNNGRAEIEFDDGSVLRLAEKTDIEILTMREQLIQIKVMLGLCSLTSRSNVQFEISTPAAAFVTAEKGNYRFDIAENGDSDGIVRKGSMEAINNSLSRRISAGEMLHALAAEGGAEVAAYSQRDAWDEWNDRRNANATAAESSRYLADNVYIGASDLDIYGNWTTVAGYGSAWFPRVSLGWSPYDYGRWQYRPLWGWTWVSYDPWGWLPYHYGRWYFTAENRWCWLPGPSFGFHFWSPALVRFYRGDGWLSWIALGPGDYYDINNYYFNHSDRANIYYLNELRLLQRRSPDDLINRAHEGAFRTVRADVFLNGVIGQKTEQVRVVDPRQSGRMVTGTLDVKPTNTSYAPSPGGIVERPAERSRAIVVHNDPEFKSRGDRFAIVNNPQVSVPKVRVDAAGRTNQPGGRVTTMPDAGSNNGRTATAGGNANASRQRETANTPNPASPKGNGASSGSVRQMTVPQAGSNRPLRQMESATPARSASQSRMPMDTPSPQPGNSSRQTAPMPNSSQSPASGSGSQSIQSRPAVVAPAPSSRPSGSEISTPSRSNESARPVAPSDSTPVKKETSQTMPSNYAPRQYNRSASAMQAYSAPASGAASMPAGSAFTTARRPEMGSSLPSSASGFGGARTYSAPARTSVQPAIQGNAFRESVRVAPQGGATQGTARPASQGASRTQENSARSQAQGGNPQRLQR
jgi:hypothetical protein